MYRRWQHHQMRDEKSHKISVPAMPTRAYGALRSRRYSKHGRSRDAQEGNDVERNMSNVIPRGIVKSLPGLPRK